MYSTTCYMFHTEFSGMPFNQAISILKRQDRYIKGVQVWYSDQVGRDLTCTYPARTFFTSYQGRN